MKTIMPFRFQRLIATPAVLIAVLLPGRLLGQDTTPPAVAINSPTNGAAVTALGTVTGWATDDSGTVTNVSLVLYELDPNGGPGRYWDGTNWQMAPFPLATVLADTNWSKTASVTLPPLNSGLSFEITATATDPSSNSASTTITIQKPPEELTWDSGSTHLGTQVKTNPHTLGGSFIFRIITSGTAVGGWRTALTVTSGEANVYLRKGSPPTTATFNYNSARVGSDGWVLHNSQFADSEEWFYVVESTPGSTWTLVSGEPYVLDLGALPDPAASGNTNVNMGAEGYRFFRTTTPSSVLGWRLWLNGATNTILVKKGFIPLLGQTERQQDKAMLLVPDYLAGDLTYFVGVPGPPAQALTFHSKQQPVTDIPFNFTNNVAVTGYPYTTYRVAVPINQIAWEVRTTPTAGDPNVAVRRGAVPNEFDNDAFSDVAGSIEDSFTLVPPTLSDGTFYITVYGDGSHTFDLRNGEPTITPRAYIGTTTNDAPSRAGWRFYVVSDVGSQIGTLGWELELFNHVPGTEIALRRNGVPGRWNYRVGGSTASIGHVEYTSTAGFLQRPGHQADIWYIGVYQAATNLGPFVLTTRALTAPPLAFDNGSTHVAGLAENRWVFFRVDVPPDMEGWDLRLTNVTTGNPRLSVRRDMLPDSFGGWTYGAWPSGFQISPATDWTRLSFNADGSDNYGRLLAVGRNNMLQTGTYYVGVRSETGAATFQCLSRGIGTNRVIGLTNLAFSGTGSKLTNSAGLPPREAAYYRLVIPSNAPNWLLRLTPTSGDAMLAVQRDVLPNISVGAIDNRHNQDGKWLHKLGKEHYLLLPGEGEPALSAETNYIAVISEGVGPDFGAGKIGSNVTAYVLESLGSLVPSTLGSGTLPAVGGGPLTQSVSLEGGQIMLARFTVPPGIPAMEVRLLSRVGNPSITLRAGTNAPYPHVPVFVGEDYGAEGGWFTGRREASELTTIANPTPGMWTVTLKAEDDGGVYPDASCDVSIVALPSPTLVFNGGTASVAGQSPGTWRYYQVTVPTNALGWDLRLTNVTDGTPYLVVRRDLLPDSLGSDFIFLSEWPSGSQLAAGGDWTGRSRNADDTDNYGRLLALGMGNPLTNGVYYVGIFSAGTLSADYTFLSRGIGSGFAIGLTNLSFSGAGSAHTNSLGLPTREGAYYRLVIPSNAPSWHVRVTPDSDGELLLLVQPDTVPNSFYNPYGRVMQKLGKELYALFPVEGQPFIPPGTNYLVVPSEGFAPVDASHVGPGNVTFRIESLGPVPVTALGVLSEAGPALSQHVTLEAGEVKVFRFTLTNAIPSVEVRLTNRVGNPVLALRPGTNVPIPQVPYVGATYYGVAGGYGSARLESPELITLANVTAGDYTLTVLTMDVGGTFTNAECDLLVTPRGPALLAFDGGSDPVSSQLAQTWKFYRFTVPADAEGWELRVTGVSGGTANMYVRRDALPASDAPGVVFYGSTWPSGGQIAAGSDWTRLPENDGSSSYGHYLAFGRNNPLEPGTYYVGIFNESFTTAVDYTLTSRGIGGPYSIPITPLAFGGGTIAPASLPARNVAYFRVAVPASAASWKVRLNTAAGGEARLLLRKGFVPNIATGFIFNSVDTDGKHLAKAGNEHYVLLPSEGQTNIAGDTYYLAVVSEGINPGPNIGGGSSSFTLESFGELPVAALGLVPGVGSMISHHITLEGGQTTAWRFNVGGGVDWVELRLANRVGSPAIATRPGAETPYPNVPSIFTPYGADGGYLSGRRETFTFLTLVRPDPTNALTVKAEAPGGYPDAEADIEIEQKLPGTLAYSNGIVASTLADNQRTFYRITVPTNQIGWRLDLIATNGTPTLRARKDLLPSDDEPAMPFGGPSVIIAPPFLEPGTWYVEVKGGGLTDFTLISNPVLLERPAWNMPAFGASVTTTGLPPSGPVFGDTGVGTNGVPLPGDQGTDLGVGDFHFYGFSVPNGNVGLLRTELLAISGNPDLYVRRGGVPTFNHSEFGASGGSLVDYQLVGSGSEYGNFVPIDGRTETQLGPGLWYVSVRANASNVRYRMKLTVGTMTNLASGTTLASQLIPAGDWRYYRVAVPSNAPQSLTVTYSQQQGDVEMYVRDTIPPGDPYDPLVGYRRWGRDFKNGGPYPDFPDPGAYTGTVPPVRPVHVYYVGFRAVSDASFTVGVTFSPLLINVPNVIAFYGGTFTVTVPAFGTAKFRVAAPADATSWRHSNTHSAAILLYLDQGTLPDLGGTGYNIWNSGGVADSELIQYLYGWPWVANQHYFFIATNTAGTPQSLTIRMDGRNAATDDTDGDGLPDSWEILYFDNLAQVGSQDFDGDGVNNATEFAEGTNPASAASFRPRLTVSISGAGNVVIEPNLPSYMKGQTVTLTAVPDAGQFFNSWTGDVTSAANPLSLVMSTNRVLIANFSGETTPLVFTNFSITGGRFAFTITGPAGSALVVLASENLVSWTPIVTNAPFTGTFSYEDTATGAHTRRNYRARLAP